MHSNFFETTVSLLQIHFKSLFMIVLVGIAVLALVGNMLLNKR